MDMQVMQEEEARAGRLQAVEHASSGGSMTRIAARRVAPASPLPHERHCSTMVSKVGRSCGDVVSNAAVAIMVLEQ